MFCGVVPRCVIFFCYCGGPASKSAAVKAAVLPSRFPRSAAVQAKGVAVKHGLEALRLVASKVVLLSRSSSPWLCSS